MSAKSQTFNSYMYRSFIMWLVGMVFGLSFVIFLSNLVENLRRTSDIPNVELYQVILLSVLELPRLMLEVLPILLFFSAVGCLWWRTRSQELIVARAIGLSVWQFLRPLALSALVVGALFAGGINPLTEIASAAHERLERQFFKRPAAPTLKISSTGFWLKERLPESVGTSAFRLIRGKSIKVTQEQAVLNNAEIFTIHQSSQIQRKLKVASIQIVEGEMRLTKVIDETDPDNPVALDDTILDTTILIDDLRTQKVETENPNFWQLPEHLSNSKLSPKQTLLLEMKYQKLLALPFSLLALMMLAALFSLRMQRKGSVGALIISGVILALGLHFVGDVLFSLGLAGRLWAPVAIWSLPLVIGLFSTGVLLSREDG